PIAADNESELISARNLYRALQQIRSRFPGTYEKETLVLASDNDGSPLRAIMSLSHRQSAETIIDSSAAPVSQELDEHLQWTKEEAESIARRLDLPQNIASAVVLAARFHDLGKNREGWQTAIGNPPNGNDWKPWAKSAHREYDRSVIGKYRHEFGSLREAMSISEITDNPERDLILHLIACHHGWARPHFEPEQWDIEVSDEENH